jgi:hypothetical protein
LGVDDEDSPGLALLTFMPTIVVATNAEIGRMQQAILELSN